jgi:hypothetical protein
MSDGPDFIVIGAMKCATSTLHDQLSLQDGIFMTTPKEPNYFSDDEVFERGPEWYEGLFASAPEGHLRGESSTHYTKLPTYPRTVERMNEQLPELRLVYVMRHPVDRLVSHYVHAWTEREVGADVEEAVANCPELTDYGRYAMQLEPYLEAWGPRAILPVSFDRLREDPQAVLEEVAAFIGHEGPVAWREAAAEGNVSAKRLRRSPVRDALVWNPVSTWLRRRLVPRSWRERVKRLWQIRRRPELRPETVSRLTEVFDEDLSRLGKWLGLELNCANFRDLARRPGLSFAGLEESEE